MGAKVIRILAVLHGVPTSRGASKTRAGKTRHFFTGRELLRKFKSPLHVVSAFLLRSRESLRATIQKLREQRQRLELQLLKQSQDRLRQDQKIDELKFSLIGWE